MSAKSMEQRSAVMKAVDEVEPLDAARRPAPFVAVGVEDKGWPVELLHQAAGRETQHAERPAGRTHHDHGRGVVQLFNLELRLTDDLGGELLTLGILILQSLRQWIGRLAVVAHQQLKG